MRAQRLQRGVAVVVREDLAVGEVARAAVRTEGVAERPPLPHADAMAVAVADEDHGRAGSAAAAGGATPASTDGQRRRPARGQTAEQRRAAAAAGGAASGRRVGLRRRRRTRTEKDCHHNGKP